DGDDCGKTFRNGCDSKCYSGEEHLTGRQVVEQGAQQEDSCSTAKNDEAEDARKALEGSQQWRGQWPYRGQHGTDTAQLCVRGRGDHDAIGAPGPHQRPGIGQTYPVTYSQPGIDWLDLLA